MRISKDLIVFSVLYLTFASLWSGLSGFHRFWSLAIFFLSALAGSLNGRLLTWKSLLLLSVSLLVAALSPLQPLIFKSGPSNQEFKALQILDDGRNLIGDSKPTIFAEFVPPFHLNDMLLTLSSFASIVAVHGLGSAPDTAWVHKGGNNSMWLRDFLPKAGLNARIMTYNHNTAWKVGALSQKLKDYGQHLLLVLDDVRQTDEV
jgi:hypothetical protein